MSGTSDDDELVTHYISRGFHNTKKSGRQIFVKNWTLNVKRQTYFIHMLWDFFVNLKENLKVLLSPDNFLEKYTDVANIS